MWPLLNRENVHCKHLQQPILPQQDERTSPQVPAQSQIPFDPAQNGGGGIGTSQTMGRGRGEDSACGRLNYQQICRTALWSRGEPLYTYAGRKPDSVVTRRGRHLVTWIDKRKTRNRTVSRSNKSCNVSCSVIWYNSVKTHSKRVGLTNHTYIWKVCEP